MKLIHLANKLHFDSQEWVIRQMLFFRPNDTVNAYAFAENERYLRNRPFIQDARIITLETASQDTVDVLVITKDVFEYSFDLRELAPSGVGAKISNDNLFGAAQGVQFGFRWKSSYSRPWGTEARYTKYNLLGSFVDVTVGYTHLNTNSQLDTGVYEGSYYIRMERPLYRSSAKITGGLSSPGTSVSGSGENQIPSGGIMHINWSMSGLAGTSVTGTAPMAISIINPT